MAYTLQLSFCVTFWKVNRFSEELSMGTALITPPGEHDHRIGFLSASVVIVEYGDFECPYCRVASPVIDKLVSEFQSQICFIYRHFPMRNIHPHAELAALAAEAAGEQNKFWEMHHLLFQNGDSLSSQNIGLLAQSLDLDMDRFLEDYQRSDLLEKIHQDFLGAVKSGVTGTPTFFLNGYHYDNSSTYEPLRDAIVELLDIGHATHY